MGVAAEVVAMFEDIAVGGTETMFAGRQRLVEVEEAGCMLMALKVAGVYWQYKQASHRLVGGTRLTL